MFDDQGLLPVHVELHYDSKWNEIPCEDTNVSDGITITRGRSDLASTPEPSSCTLTLSNTDGRYSPRNPASPLYGKIGRNTPLRVRIGDSRAGLALPGVDGAYASTPDAAALDITGDIDVRAEITPESWRPATGRIIASKYLTTGNQRSWVLFLKEDGTLQFQWEPGGNFTGSFIGISTAAIPEGTDRLALRATVEVDNGASGRSVRFYTAPSIDGTWTQLGSTVTTAGTTSIFASTADLEIGSNGGGTSSLAGVSTFDGTVYAFELRNGIDGTLVASPEFAAQEPGTTSFTDDSALLWSMNGRSDIADPSVRFTGEVSSWPPRWDSPAYVSVPLQAAGVRRRLTQGTSALRSALYRGMTGGLATQPVAYWPCEDQQSATSFASAFGHAPMRLSPTGVRPAEFSGVPASEAIPSLSDGGWFSGVVPPYPGTDFARAMFLIDIPENGVSEETTIMRMVCDGGTVDRVSVNLLTNGNLSMGAFAQGEGTPQIGSTGEIGFGLNGKAGLFWIYLVQNGANVTAQMGFAALGVLSGGLPAQDLPLNGQQFGRCSKVVVVPGGTGEGLSIGHVVVLSTDEFWTIRPFANAWTSETTVERIARLASEESIPITVRANEYGSEQVGPQKIDSFMNLMDEAAFTDLGIMIDRRDANQMLYRTRATLYNQDPVVIDYTRVSPPFEPVDDDQETRNDITVDREGGSSFRAVEHNGALSVNLPPLGVGRYDDQQTINVYRDEQLPDQAYFRLNLGTVDKARYPQAKVSLTANADLIAAIMPLDVGDRIVITNPPPWLPPEDIDLIIQGYSEWFDGIDWGITFTCTPGNPWNMWVFEDPTQGRADTVLSATQGTFAAGTDTTMTVETLLGPVWTTRPQDFPFVVDVAGVLVRVTGISGATSPQTFTVEQQTLNGVSKTFGPGAQVKLATPAVVAL